MSEGPYYAESLPFEVQGICISPELSRPERIGKLADDEVSVQFQRIGKDGNLVADVVTLDSILGHAAPNDEVEILESTKI
jgi:hypothetical protein